MKTRVHIQYWGRRNGLSPIVGKGVELNDPEGYAAGLGKNGTIARITVVETGETYESGPIPDSNPECDFCGEPHPLPHDGSCLL